MITALSPEERGLGVVAYSSGNHGYAEIAGDFTAVTRGADSRALGTGDDTGQAAGVARTAADALHVEKVGDLTFARIRELVTDIVTVTEEQMLTAVRRLALEARLVAEPGGAVAAAALDGADGIPEATPERTVVAVLSGGNSSPNLPAAVPSGQNPSYTG